MGSPRSFAIGGDLVFSVKLLCGTILPGPGLPLAAGTYLTAINIHNLSTSQTGIAVWVNDVQRFGFLLAARAVHSFDCRNIVHGSASPSSFAPTDLFSEGFVALHAVEAKGRQLNVVPVYTVATVPQ